MNEANQEESKMSTIQQELESFTGFVQQWIRVGQTGLSIDELYDQWRAESLSAEDALAVSASLQDIENGETGRDFSDFAQEFTDQKGLGSQ